MTGFTLSPLAGRILNVAVCPADTNEPPRVLNYLSAPNVVVWSAVSCSSAFPFLFMPQDLLARNNRGELVKYGPFAVSKSGCGVEFDTVDSSKFVGLSKLGFFKCF